MRIFYSRVGCPEVLSQQLGGGGIRLSFEFVTSQNAAFRVAMQHRSSFGLFCTCEQPFCFSRRLFATRPAQVLFGHHKHLLSNGIMVFKRSEAARKHIV